MPSRSAIASIVFFLSFFVDPALILSSNDKAPILVTPAWVYEHSNDSGLVVLNVAQNARLYREGHIPGARFLWPGWITSSTPELSVEVASVAQLDTLLEGMGVSTGSRIILCGVGGNVSMVARVYVTLEYLGAGERTSILDGGFEAWKSAGYPASQAVPLVTRGSFTPSLQPETVVDAEYVNSRLTAKGTAILDARSPNYFHGLAGGSPRPGHIPGAHNLFYTTLFDSTDRYLPVDSLRTRFASAGFASGDEIITYCHVGQTACAAYVAARLLGHRVHLYDGSFEDWSGRQDLPMEDEPRVTPALK
jgi:thiosulfate/3-mercaptopyruvate sulfurtransferase